MASSETMGGTRGCTGEEQMEGGTEGMLSGPMPMRAPPLIPIGVPSKNHIALRKEAECRSLGQQASKRE